RDRRQCYVHPGGGQRQRRWKGNALTLDASGATGTQSIAPAGTYIFSASGISGNAIAVGVNHHFATGEQVTYRSTGQSIGGLTNGGTYYAIVVDATHIKLAASASAALAGSALPLTPGSATGTQSIGAGAPMAFAFSAMNDVS